MSGGERVQRVSKRRGRAIPWLVVALLAPLLAVVAPVPASAQQVPGTGTGEGARIEQVGGLDRIGTAITVSEVFFDDAEHVVLARADDFADALAAGPLARALRAPILLNRTDDLDAALGDELVRLGAGHVVVVGGVDAISGSVVEQLGNLGVDVDRLGGRDRYETARLIAGEVGGGDAPAVLALGRSEAAGDGFADALTAGTFGLLGTDVPTLLTEREALPGPSTAALSGRPSVTVVGGPAAVSSAVEASVAAVVGSVRRLSGVDRYATSVVVADAVSEGVREPVTLLMATGATFPDSLVAGALTEALESPIVLLPPALPEGPGSPGERLTAWSPALSDYLRDVCPTVLRAVVLGLEAAVSAEVRSGVEELLTCDKAPEPEPGSTTTTTVVPGGSGSSTTSTSSTSTTSTSSTTTTSTSTTTTTPPELGVVPDVVGSRQVSAIAAIDDAGLVPRLTAIEPHPTVPAGRVLRQDPAPATRVAPGSEVGYVLSSGPELVSVPDVIGLSAAAAQGLIDGAGLAVGRQGSTESDAVDVDEVAFQLPLAGQRVRPGTPVDLDLAIGGVNGPPSITSTPGTTAVIDGSTYRYDADATDPDGDELTYVLQAGPSNAGIDEVSGVVSWTPRFEDIGPVTIDDSGPHDFVVRVEDGRGGIDTRSWTLDVTRPNRAPVAQDDLISATVGEPRAIDASELLANDGDPDDDPIAITSYRQPQTGVVTQTGPQQLTYTANQPTSTDLRRDIELTHAIPVTLTSDAITNGSYPLKHLLDGYVTQTWFTTNSPTLPITLTFAFETDVTVRRVDLYGSRYWGEQGYDVKTFDVVVRDVDETELFATATPLQMPLEDPADGSDAGTADPDGSFDLVPLNGGEPIEGARSVDVIIQTVGGRNYPGVAEIDIWGDAVPVSDAPRLAWVDEENRIYSTPSVADLDLDGTPEIVAARGASWLRVYDGATGTREWSIQDADDASQAPALADVADCVDSAPSTCEDDHLEVVYVGSDTSMIRVRDAAGTLVGEVDTLESMTEDPPVLADVDGDGDVEVIGGTSRVQVIDIDRATGELSLRYRTEPTAACGNNSYRTCIPVVVDVDVDGEVEIVVGHYVFDAATGAIEQIGTGLSDAFVGVANFDDDPEGEIVRVDAGLLHIVNHDFTTVWGPIPLASRDDEASIGAGGPPTIGDFDGDGRPEIGIAGARVYAVYDPDLPVSDPPADDDGVLWKAPTVDGSSNRTGSTIFDFDDDGRPEVVYGSEQNLWIYDGPTGEVRWRRPISSATTTEAPVVADVDGDGQAELVVNVPGARSEDRTLHPAGLSVYEAPGDNWVRARAIWNQHTYNVTNVGADGSIPRVPQVNWLQGGLNNFRQQSFPPDDPSRLDQFSYTIEDPDGAPASATVYVDARPPQNDPVITCLPPTRATVGSTYRGRVCAEDPDGDTLTWTGGAQLATTSFVAPDSLPWLAGQPDGTAIGTDGSAPDQSPVLVADDTFFAPGEVLTFRATGTAGADVSTDGPEGYSGETTYAARLGLSGLRAKYASVVGVFLTDDMPDPGATPPDLDFSPAGLGPDRTTLSPQLQQPFFIGDGRTTGGVVQEFVVPDGATRLFVGVMDDDRWASNPGDGFEVTVVSQRSAGLALDPSSGVVTWTPPAVGEYRLEGAVTDDSDQARSTEFSRTIEVQAPVAVPDLIGPPRLDEADARAAILAADLAVGAVAEVFSVDVPAGEVVEQFPPAGSTAPVDARVTLTLSKGPSPADSDADGDGFTPNQGDCDDTDDNIHPDAEEVDNDGVDSDCDGEDGGLPVSQVGITGADSDLVIGRTRSFTAQALLTDGRVVDITDLATFATTDEAIATIDGRTVTAVAPGGFGVTASFSGLTAQKDLTAIVGIAADETPPTAEIDTPAAGDEVSAQVEVIGTAADDNLTGWSLLAIDEDGATLTEVAAGTTAVTDGVLGTFAATAVPSGTVTLRLDVEDAGGNVSRVDVPVIVLEGPQPGAFSLSFTDVAVPMSGIPLAVVRTYDSRDRSVGDFGAAWSLDITGLDLRVGRDQGVGWELVTGRFASTSLQPTADHTVTVTLPGGDQEVFDLVPSPRTSSFVPLSFTQAAYQPRRGTTGTLVPTGNRNLLVLPGSSGVELVDDMTLDAYDPPGFVYTRQDGTAFTVDASGEVSRIVDPNGNVITVDEDGITHSGGRSVAFERDALGRITSVTDPDGHAQTYRYSAAGDLVAHTDREGNTTTFAYDAGHYLVRVVDPLGRPLARMEYDDQGRLVATTDAEGRRIEVTHDVGASTEQVRNPDGSQTIVQYDADGNVVLEIDELGRRTERSFDDDGNLLTEEDGEGRVTTFTWDEDGNETSRTDGLGNTTAYTYDAAGRVVRVETEDGDVTTFAHDAAGNLLSRTAPDGSTTRWSYDDAGNVVTTTDALGNTTTVETDATGNPTRVVDAVGRTVEADWTSGGTMTSVELTDGTTTLTSAFDRNRNGDLLTVTDATGAVATQTVDANGQSLTQTDPEGRTYAFQYGVDGRRTGTTLPDGTQLDTSHDLRGRVDAVETLQGATQVLDHDASGLVTSFTHPAGTPGDLGDDPVTALAYDDSGRPRQMTPPGGGTRTLAYDAAGRVVGVQGPVGGAATQTLDAQGRVVAETDPAGRTTTYALDELGRVASTTHPGGAVTSATWDALGRMTTSTDEIGRTTTYTYDAAGRLASVEDPAGAVTTYRWNALDRVTATIDALGRTTRYDWDGVGRLARLVRPDGATTTFDRDRSGLVTRIEDPNGSVVTLAYDELRRVVRQTWDDGSQTTYTYDDADVVPATITDARGTTTLTTDEQGRITSRTEPDGTVVAWEYDADGRIVALTTPWSRTERTYDAAGRLVEVADPVGTTTHTYDAVGNLLTTTLPNGVVETRTYDARDRILTIRAEGPGGVVTDLTHTWTAAGQLATVVDAVEGTTSTYTYDGVGRLAGETVTGGGADRAVTHTYDVVGNRTRTEDSVAGTTTFEYDSADQLVRTETGAEVTTFTYDAAGNQLVAATGTTQRLLGWDATGRLTSAVASDAGATSTTVRYGYDADGLLVSRTGADGEVRFLQSLAEPVSHVLARYRPDGSLVDRSVLGAGRLAVTDGSVPTFLHGDHLATVLATTDDTGAVTAREDRGPWGGLRSDGEVGSFGFTGEYTDPVTGLVSLRARWLDPGVGRFLSPDPFLGVAVDPMTLHDYLYAYGDPVNHADPTGLDPSLTEVMTALTIIGTLGAVFMAGIGTFAGRLGVVEWGGPTYDLTVPVVGAFSIGGRISDFVAENNGHHTDALYASIYVGPSVSANPLNKEVAGGLGGRYGALAKFLGGIGFSQGSAAVLAPAIAAGTNGLDSLVLIPTYATAGVSGSGGLISAIDGMISTGGADSRNTIGFNVLLMGLGSGGAFPGGSGSFGVASSTDVGASSVLPDVGASWVAGVTMDFTPRDWINRPGRP